MYMYTYILGVPQNEKHDFVRFGGRRCFSISFVGVLMHGTVLSLLFLCNDPLFLKIDNTVCLPFSFFTMMGKLGTLA